MKTRMITKGLLAVLMVAMTAMGGYAQDSYHKAAKEYLSANGTTDMMKAMFLNINDVIFQKSDNVNIDELTERFFNERFEDSYVKLLTPSLKSRDLTEDDLREVTRLLSTPEGKLYSTHAMKCIQKMPGALISAMMKNMSFWAGLDHWADTKIEINPEIDANYAAKFRQIQDRYFSEDKLHETLTEALKEDTTERNASLVQWFAGNIGTILLNCAHDYLTEEDLDYGIWLCSHDSYLKTKDFYYTKSSSGEEFKSLLDEYTEWMEANGAQPYDEKDFSLDRMRKLGEFFGFDSLPSFGPSYDDVEGIIFDDEIIERDQLTSTIFIESSRDLIDMYDIEITYKGEDGVNVTDTINTTSWVKDVVNKNFPAQIGLVDSRFLLKPGVKADKQAYDLVCDFTISAQNFSYNFKIVEERNVPADKILSIFNNYDFRLYQENLMKKWGVFDVPLRGTFTVEKQEDADYPFLFIQDK